MNFYEEKTHNEYRKKDPIKSIYYKAYYDYNLQ